MPGPYPNLANTWKENRPWNLMVIPYKHIRKQVGRNCKTSDMAANICPRFRAHSASLGKCWLFVVYICLIFPYNLPTLQPFREVVAIIGTIFVAKAWKVSGHIKQGFVNICPIIPKQKTARNKTKKRPIRFVEMFFCWKVKT